MAGVKKTQEIKEADANSYSFDELVASNIAILTQGLSASSTSVELLTKKVTSLACHVVAVESLLAEVIAVTGVDLAKVNRDIRSRISNQLDMQNDSEVVVDIAATIASPALR